MQFPAEPQTISFTDRRKNSEDGSAPAERRQFSDGHKSDRPEVDEFAKAIDAYKVNNRRRFITFEEIFDVMTSLGYHK